MPGTASLWRGPGLVVFCVVGGLVFGGLIAAVTQPAHRRYLSAVAGLGTEDRKRVAVALRSGEVPTDPGVLAAAIEVGQNFLSRGGSTHRRLVLNGVSAVLFLGAGILYLTGGNARMGGFWIGLAVLVIGSALWDRYYRQRMQRNVETLRGAVSGLPGVSPP